MASMFGLENREVIRIRVKKLDGLIQPEYKKFCVDPQITSYEILQSLLARAFNIKSDFCISYLSEDERGQEAYLSLLSDWDLDAAFLTASDPYLRLKVDLKPFEEGLEDWDIVRPVEVSPKRQVTNLLEKGTILGQLSNQVGKTVSQAAKVIGLRYEEDESFRPSKKPMNDVEFRRFQDNVGHLIQPQQFRLAVYQGGVEPALRTVVWRHLLNVYPEGMSGRERFEYFKRKTSEYFKLRDEWRDLFLKGKETEQIKYVTNMVKKDVLRTDRTHPFYAGADDSGNVLALFNLLVTYALTHPDVSYCQGMSDIAAPILVVQNDEAHAYLCFCGAMKRIRGNFSIKGETMMTKFQHLALLLQHHDPLFWAYMKAAHADDMFFCYRWLLLELKREFPFDDALIMLETMWSSLPPDPPENEIDLADPVYRTEGLSHTPASPTLANQAYMRLRSLRRHEHDCGGDTSLSAVTPREGNFDPSDFVALEDKTANGLKDVSCNIDKSLGTQPPDCETDLNGASPEASGGVNEMSLEEEFNQLSLTRASPLPSPERSSSSPSPVKSPSSSEASLAQKSSSTSSSSQNPSSHGKESPISTVTNPSVLLNDKVVPDSPKNLKRPSDIPLKKAYDPQDNHVNSTVMDSQVLQVSNGEITEQTMELNSCESATSFCEEATNLDSHPSIDFIKVTPEKLPPLPSPQEIGAGNPFLLFLCLTLLLQHRDHIMTNRMDYNDLAMHFDKMVRQHHVYRVLHQAKSLYAVYLRQQASMLEQEETSPEDVSV